MQIGKNQKFGGEDDGIFWWRCVGRDARQRQSAFVGNPPQYFAIGMGKFGGHSPFEGLELAGAPGLGTPKVSKGMRPVSAP